MTAAERQREIVARELERLDCPDCRGAGTTTGSKIIEAFQEWDVCPRCLGKITLPVYDHAKGEA